MNIQPTDHAPKELEKVICLKQYKAQRERDLEVGNIQVSSIIAKIGASLGNENIGDSDPIQYN